MHPPVVFDYDGDGLDDIATVCQTVHYTILRGKDGRQLLPRPRDASSQNFGGEAPSSPKAGRSARCSAAPMWTAIDVRSSPSSAARHHVGVIRASGEHLRFVDLPWSSKSPSRLLGGCGRRR